MKKFLVMAVAALMAVSAFAQTIPASWAIEWYVGMAYSPDDPSGNTGVLENYSIFWDLCWSASADKSDEVVLGSRIWDSGSSVYTDDQNPLSFYGSGAPTYNEFLEPLDVSHTGSAIIPLEGTRTTSPGYIWQRIIAVSDSPTGTDYIWDGAVTSLPSVTSTMVPCTGLDGNAALIGDPEYGVFWSVYSSPAAIPEPATMSLLGLGALAMVIRRKLRK